MPNDASIVYRPLVVYTSEYVLIELILDEIFPKPPSPLLVPTISGVLPRNRPVLPLLCTNRSYPRVRETRCYPWISAKIWIFFCLKS